MMVNGGGSVTVRFIRGTAPPAQTTVILSWNTLVTLDPVILLQVILRVSVNQLLLQQLCYFKGTLASQVMLCLVLVYGLVVLMRF